jgi:hypothetical protein
VLGNPKQLQFNVIKSLGNQKQFTLKSKETSENPDSVNPAAEAA